MIKIKKNAGLSGLVAGWRHGGAGGQADGPIKHRFAGMLADVRPSVSTQEKVAVAILGAGHGGLALAGYLARKGHKVTLWNRSSSRVEAVAALGGLYLTLPGKAKTFTPIVKATGDIRSAVTGVSLVLVAVPASGHADVVVLAHPTCVMVKRYCSFPDAPAVHWSSSAFWRRRVAPPRFCSVKRTLFPWPLAV